jgi:hypothetical protein
MLYRRYVGCDKPRLLKVLFLFPLNARAKPEGATVKLCRGKFPLPQEPLNFGNFPIPATPGPFENDWNWAEAS